jgi:hypothetical protein
MRQNATAVLLAVLLSIFLRASGFAEWMTKDFCRRSMAVGEVIMNAEVTASEDRHLLVFRGEEEIHSGDFYIPGEVLDVRVSDAKPQFVFEVEGPESAQFTGGGCDGTRIANKPRVELNMPSVVTAEENQDKPINDVKIRVAWATSHSTVYVCTDFILVPKPHIAEADAKASVPVSEESKDKTTESSNQILPVSAEESEQQMPPQQQPVAPSLRKATASKPSDSKTSAQAPAPNTAHPPTMTSVLSSANNLSFAMLHQTLSDFTSKSQKYIPSTLNQTYHTLKHHLPLHYNYNSSADNSLVSRTGQLFSELEKAALEELASSSADLSNRLHPGQDPNDRVALQLQAREKRQHEEKQQRRHGNHKTDHSKAHADAAKGSSISALKTQNTLRGSGRHSNTNAADRVQQQVALPEKASLEAGRKSDHIDSASLAITDHSKTTDADTDQKKSATTVEEVVDNSLESLSRRKREKVRTLKRQQRTPQRPRVEAEEEEIAGLNNASNYAEAKEEEEEEEEEEDVVEDEEGGIDEKRSAHATEREDARSHRSRHSSHRVHSSRHPVLRMVIRILLALGLLFVGAMCCGSAIVFWHSRFALLRSIKRRLGWKVNDE